MIQNYRYFKAILILIALSFSLAAKAADCLIGNPLVGDNSAWQGTIGDVPVTLQFEENADYGIVGSYYYRNNFNELTLKQNDDLGSWLEYNDKNQLTGSIENYNCEGDLLTAEWKSADSKTTLPLKATRVKEYQKNRLENIKFIATPKVFGQRQYQILSALIAKSTSLRLISTGLGIKKINAELKNNYLSSIESEIDCKRGTESHLSVLNWNSTFITIRNDGIEDCGGAHANYGSYTSVYNLSSEI